MKRRGGTGFVIFVLFAILFIGFGSAAYWPSFATNTPASAGDTVEVLIFNVSNLSSTGNNLTLIEVSLESNASSIYSNVSSVNISDGTNDYSNGSITNAVPNIDVSSAQITGETNFTLSITLSPSATHGFSVRANIETITNQTNVSYNTTIPYFGNYLVITESNSPTATATCPTTTYAGEPFPCTCSGTDSETADSGVASSSGSSNSPDGTSVPVTIGSFTYTCTVTDNAGNSASDTAVYAIYSTGGGSSSPGPPKNSHIWSKITPGAVAIMQDFDPEIGVKQIQVSVNSEAQNVQITVTKYDGKPAEVSLAKSGKVYQYVQIDEKNIGGKLSAATVQFRVEKSWASGQGLEQDEVSAYRFDGATGKWNELITTPMGEDATYYYYEVGLNSFSYFAISEKALAPGEGVTAEGEEVVEKGASLTWVWVVVIIILIALLWFGMGKKRRRHR